MTTYKKFLHAAYSGANINLGTATIKALFTSSAHTPNTADAGHEFYSDITGAHILLEETMTGGTWVARVLNCDDFVVSDPGGATTATNVIFCIWTGTGSTSRLISVEDIADITFDGTDDDATIHASGIFRLGGA